MSLTKLALFFLAAVVVARRLELPIRATIAIHVIATIALVWYSANQVEDSRKTGAVSFDAAARESFEEMLAGVPLTETEIGVSLPFGMTDYEEQVEELVESVIAERVTKDQAIAEFKETIAYLEGLYSLDYDGVFAILVMTRVALLNFGLLIASGVATLLPQGRHS